MSDFPDSSSFAAEAVSCRDEQAMRRQLAATPPISEYLTVGFSALGHKAAPLEVKASESASEHPSELHIEDLTVSGADRYIASINPAGVELECVLLEDVCYWMPPLFGCVESGVFRCGFPSSPCFPFLERLHLKTVINLLDRLPDEYATWLQEQGITYVHCPVKGNKLHCEEMDCARVRVALSLLMDKRRHPLLLHCRSGKHRTGALIGCLRMLQAWDLERACDEYVLFCKHKQRAVDKQYIERFDPRTLPACPHLPPAKHWAGWVPQDACARPSALEAAIQKGLISREQAAAGLRVSAIESGPDEPGGPFLPALIPAVLHLSTGLQAEVAGEEKTGVYVPFTRASAQYSAMVPKGSSPLALTSMPQLQAVLRGAGKEEQRVNGGPPASPRRHTQLPLLCATPASDRPCHGDACGASGPASPSPPLLAHLPDSKGASPILYVGAWRVEGGGDREAALVQVHSESSSQGSPSGDTHGGKEEQEGSSSARSGVSHGAETTCTTAAADAQEVTAASCRTVEQEASVHEAAALQASLLNHLVASSAASKAASRPPGLGGVFDRHTPSS